MTPRSRIPAAAPAWVRALVAGPDRVGQVVHRGSDAIYLDVAGFCLGVLSTAATAVPCAVRTALPDLPAGLLAAQTAQVGEGRIALDGADVVVVRTVDAGVPQVPSADVLAWSARLEDAVGDRVDHVRAELPAEALDHLAAGRPEAVLALLGRGSGLTPVGDDVLSGWLATVVAASVPAAETPVGTTTRQHAPTTTTLLSATLLDCARRGDVIPQYRSLLLSLAHPARGSVDDTVGDLLRVGHTSGAGLVLGTQLALRHLASRSPS